MPPGMKELLAPPIAFNRAYRRLTGSTVAALMLSQAVYWTLRTNDDEGWFYKTRTEWEEETGLSRSEQETARRILVATSFWEEEARGLPRRMYFRVNLDELLSELANPVQLAGIQPTGGRESSQPIGGDVAGINTETTTETTDKDSLDRMSPHGVVTAAATATYSDDIKEWAVELD